MKINSTPRLLPHLLASGALQAEPFSLVDVGASGGIGSHWRSFGDALKAVGFDMLVNEVARLNMEEQNPKVRYFAARVGYARYHELIANCLGFSSDIQDRTSSQRAQELLRISYTDNYDQTRTGAVTSDLVELDTYFLRTAPDDVDFIKTDADCHDYEVLLGARQLMGNAPIVGLLVEAPFSGQFHEATTLFANVDVLLRNLGFSLFDLDLHRYSRAALPKPFRWTQPGGTEGGQLNWADFLYLRDMGIERYEEQWGVTLSPSKLLKLCCLHELFGLQDCAAEVLLKYRDSLSNCVHIETCLDLLTPPLPDGRQVGYREYIAFFESNVEAFYSGC